MSLTYTVEPDPSSADASWVIDRLIAFNESRAGSRNVRDFGIFARDQDGELLAGLLCTRHWNYLFVSAVYVEESKRAKGIGRELLSAAEKLALQNRCDAIYLDTFDFQAPGFYEKFGFRIFGDLKDYPPGHIRYFMVKDVTVS
ncbi:MAG TPA: GNAT family N-acetyltransferase [Chthoniobacterales bacterium]|jgi:GNAT superfamily N-acetyltransferase